MRDRNSSFTLRCHGESPDGLMNLDAIDDDGVSKGNEGVKKTRENPLSLVERPDKLLILRFLQTAPSRPKNFFNSLT